MEKKKKTWTRFRHRVITAIAYGILKPITLLKYGVRVQKFKEQGDRNYLVLYNHQTPFDQFFVGISFSGPVYYMATEDIFSLGWISKLLRWAVAPIPIRKSTTDINAVMNCMKVGREGGTIAIAPEGNRTYSGRTEYMNPTIAAMAKKMKLPIALFRIEGGYGVEPRWSDKVRKGKMYAGVSRVIEPEEAAKLSNEELMEQIHQGLYVDETQRKDLYESNHQAEYLERLIYVCPDCGFSEFESRGNEFTCKTCGKTVVYGQDKRFISANWDCPFTYVGDWYDYQQNYINSLDVASLTDKPIFTDRAKVSEVIVYKRKNLLCEDAEVSLYGDRIVLDQGTEAEKVLDFAQVTAAACMGRNKLNIYHGKDIYQFKGGKRFNAIKYVNLYYRWMNITRGEFDEQFLGL